MIVQAKAGTVLVRYEAVLWSVLGAMAYLTRENEYLVYPDALWLFTLLLTISLVSAWAVRRWPHRNWPQAVCTILTFATIAAIQSRSGGRHSNLWILYLLPLLTSALMLRGRELVWIAAGASLCDALLYVGPDASWNAAIGFEMAVKNGVFWTAAGSTWVLAEAERRVRVRVSSQRAELGRLENDLQNAQESRGRDRRLAEIGLASAGTAHDMGTPLTVIRGYARVHLEQPDLDEDLKKDFERIDRAAAFCQQLSASTLARVRGEASPSAPKTNLVHALETALCLSQEVLNSQHVAVRREYAPDEISIVGQGQELERLFLNLIANSVKAMPDGGTLTLRARLLDNRQAEICVEDTGTGIPAEILSRLFTPFVTSKSGSGGTGLGLSMSWETARRFGGDLTGRNRPEGGAAFVLTLPLGTP